MSVHQRLAWVRWPVAFAARLAMVACAIRLNGAIQAPDPPRFANPYVVPKDTGTRMPGTYFFRRASVKITRNLPTTEVPLRCR